MAPRFALIDSKRDSVEQVVPYLSSNYYLAKELPEGLLIAGSDTAGWTLDDYILPRLKSGLIIAHEITEEEALALGFQPEDWVITNEEALFWSNIDGWGDLASATRFGRHEMPGLTLPQSSFSQWIPIDKAPRIEARRQAQEEPSLP